jgi:hypothetical protein
VAAACRDRPVVAIRFPVAASRGRLRKKSDDRRHFIISQGLALKQFKMWHRRAASRCQWIANPPG